MRLTKKSKYAARAQSATERMGITWRLWSQVISALARSHRVIVPDLRGLGASTRAADGYDPNTLAADYAEGLRG